MLSNHTQSAQTRHSSVTAMCTSSTSPATVAEAAAPAVSEDLLEITQENYYAYLADAPATELVVVDFYTDVSTRSHTRVTRWRLPVCQQSELACLVSRQRLGNNLALGIAPFPAETEAKHVWCC